MRLDRVSEIVEKRKEQLPVRPIIGAVPARDINASACPFSVPIILMDIRFTEFANEFAKLAALSIPFKTEGDLMIVQGSVDASTQKISADTALRESFLGLIDYFLYSRPGPYTAPSTFTATIQIVYTEGIETFAVAHEYGHLFFEAPCLSSV